MSENAAKRLERSSEDEELLRRYEAAKEADAKGDLLRITSKDEYLRLLSRS